MDLDLVGKTIDRRYKVVRQLGRGGAAIVFEVIQIGLGASRALKVLSPRQNNPEFQTIFQKTFANEIRLLSVLDHRNIVRILDCGDYTLPDSSKTTFWVMDLASEGDMKKSKDDATKSKELPSAAEAMRCFSHVLDALCYLHNRGVLHFDVKPENILLHRDKIAGDTEYKLSDLGVSKIVATGSTIGRDSWPTLDKETYVYGTDFYAPPYASGKVNRKQLVDRSELERWIPHYDLYALGLTMAELLSTIPLTSATRDHIDRLLENPLPVLVRELPSDQLKYLQRYIRTLLAPDPLDSFSSSQEAKEAFERMDPRMSLPVKVPEITSVGSRHMINLGTRAARLSDRVFRLVSHPVFHRLQRLNQLNLVDMIYPDARQSRLSHSIETFELAKEVAGHLLGDEMFRMLVSPEDLALFLCAALLHDIGHYPLQHTLEDLRPYNEHRDLRPWSDAYAAEFFLDCRMGNSEPLSKLLLSDWGIEAADLLRVIGPAPPDLPVSFALFRNLLDGAIDIDKMAYLSKDSWFSGVGYGLGVDVETLIASFAVVEAPRPSERYQIGLLDKGISAAESMIVGRYHMFSRIYWHHTNRAIMAMIRFTFRRVLEQHKRKDPSFTFKNYVRETLEMSDLEAVKYLSSEFEGLFKNEVANPLMGIADTTRTIYKRLCSYWQHPANNDIAKCHGFLSRHEIILVLDEITAECIRLLKPLVSMEIREGHLLIDVPLISKKRDLIADIFVHDSVQGTLSKLREVSRFVSLVSEDFERQVKKSRIFIHPSVREELRESGKENEARKRINAMICELADNLEPVLNQEGYEEREHVMNGFANELLPLILERRKSR